MAEREETEGRHDSTRVPPGLNKLQDGESLVGSLDHLALRVVEVVVHVPVVEAAQAPREAPVSGGNQQRDGHPPRLQVGLDQSSAGKHYLPQERKRCLTPECVTQWSP